MNGAFIPDDWDGSTYNCYRVNWPQSQQYEAILLGQASEPAFLSFWDPDTGDEQEAADAINKAYSVTVADMWTKECDDVEQEERPAFRAGQTIQQNIFAATWMQVHFQTMWFENFNPGYEIATFDHRPGDADLLGLWHYDIGVQVDSPTELWLRATSRSPTQVLCIDGGPNRRAGRMSFCVDYSRVAYDITDVEIWVGVASTTTDAMPNTYFGGQFLGKGGG